MLCLSKINILLSILISLHVLLCVVRVLTVGGVGSVISELYSWEPVFIIVGLLAAMWAFGVWTCLLRGRIQLNAVLEWVDTHIAYVRGCRMPCRAQLCLCLEISAPAVLPKLSSCHEHQFRRQKSVSFWLKLCMEPAVLWVKCLCLLYVIDYSFLFECLCDWVWVYPSSFSNQVYGFCTSVL